MEHGYYNLASGDYVQPTRVLFVEYLLVRHTYSLLSESDTAVQLCAGTHTAHMHVYLYTFVQYIHKW